MADTFHEVQFPTDISYGSSGGPEFSTEVVALSSGHEKRNVNWTNPRERWQVAYGVKTRALLAELVRFFYARQGRATGFRFKNHDDYEGTDEALGTGDAVETHFQLVKNYTSGGETLAREISKPVSGTVIVCLDGTPQSTPGQYSIDLTTGLVTFVTPPGAGVAVTATFEFDVPVRFDTDYLPVNFATYEARAADVPIVEIRI